MRKKATYPLGGLMYNPMTMSGQQQRLSQQAFTIKNKRTNNIRILLVI